MLVGIALTCSLVAQPRANQSTSRVKGAIDRQVRVVRSGDRHPLARPEYDAGAVSPNTRLQRMILVLLPDEEQQQALLTLLEAQRNPHAPEYRQWITPQAFGERFGVSGEDIERVTVWLEEQGFEVEPVPAGRRSLVFTGMAAQVDRAFHSEVHRFVVNGEDHLANAADLEIPAALADVVAGVASLHDFHARPQHHAQALDVPATPFYTSGSTHYLAPGDFASIYNVVPLYNANITGAGQTVAVVGRTNINVADVNAFRSFFKLPARPPVVVLNGTDPGIVAGGELMEAMLDVEWAGAVAKEATVKFVVSASTRVSDGVALSAQYIVDRNLAPLITVSFGLCEANYGSSGNQFWNALWQQAAAQGISVFVSSGDSGAAGCDSAGAFTATSGPGVNGLCSSPYSTCVGGTQFADDVSSGSYWKTTNDGTGSSAMGYIPEAAWNESGAMGGSGLWSSGGGASILYPKPSWQTGTAAPSQNRRYVPDVSLNAAIHDGYLVCQNGSYYVVGGTSAAAPALASAMALVLQKSGARAGNANPRFYALAAGGGSVFHDTVAGSNTVPGVTGFSAGAGFDQATGLGSIDVYRLATNWSDSATPAPSFQFSVSPLSITLRPGGSAAVALSLAALDGYSSPVTVTAGTLPRGVTSSVGSGVSLALDGSVTTITLQTGANVTPGSYSLTFSAKGGGLTKTAPLGVVVLPACKFTVSKTSLTVEGSGGSASIVIAVGAGCDWTAVTSASWIGVGTSAGSGNGTLKLTIPANSGPPRSGSVAIAGVKLTVTQGQMPVPTIGTTGGTFPAAGGTGSVAVVANAAITWTAVSSVSWVTITANDIGNGSKTVKYSVAANQGSTRSTVFLIAGRNYTVTQASGCVYRVTGAPPVSTASVMSGSLTVATGNSCTWNASSNVSWLTLVTGQTGQGNGAVYWHTVANTTGKERSAVLTVAGSKVTITQKGR
ncbi:MAG: protease pro-enzyme activation domain-containing protein [Bryobacteraceae bacterium]